MFHNRTNRLVARTYSLPERGWVKTNAAEPTFELNNRAYVLLQIMVAHDEFNSPEEAARYCTAGAVASLIESMKEDETLEIFGCEKDGAK